MKIAFDQQVFQMQNYGGISRYIMQLAHQLETRGEQPKVFAPVHINNYLRFAPKHLRSGIYVDKLRFKKFTKSIKLSHALASMWGADIIHETYYSLKPSWRKTCPIVLTAHDMIHELFADEFSADDTTRAAKIAAFHRADHIICNSYATQKDLLELSNVKPEKTSVIHLAYDNILLCEEKAAPRLVESPYILYVGNRNKYKNFTGLVEAYASSLKLSRNFKLVAFGGPRFDKKTLKHLSDLGLPTGTVVHLSGDDHVLNNLYRNAAVFVYPSHYEGFGLPPLEAMQNACPVASSNTSSMPEVIGDAAEFFDPGSREDMQRAIENIVFDGQRAAELVAKGHNRLENFSWAKCAEQTLTVYKSLT